MEILPSRVKRLTATIALMAAAIILEAVVGVFLPRGRASDNSWVYPPTVPALTHDRGSDLRIFVTAAHTMFQNESPFHSNYISPPFTASVFFPFTFLSEDAAYSAQFYLIIAENAAVMVLLALVIRFLVPADGARQMESVMLAGICFVTVTFFHFFGYPLEFSLARGNYDSLALFAMCMGFWLATRPKAGVWAPVLFLSLAVHLKVYPAVLLGIPLWKHRWRAVLPILAINLVLLFWFGLDRGVQFLEGLYVYSRNPYVWIGNHSAVAFSDLILRPTLASRFGEKTAGLLAAFLTLGLPFALWGHGAIRLIRNGFSPRNALLGFALCVPLMCILPSVSHDYKLVVTVVPGLVALFFFCDRFVSAGGWSNAAGVVATLLCLVVVAQSVFFTPVFFTANKFPAVFILQMLTYFAILGSTSAKSSDKVAATKIMSGGLALDGSAAL